MDLEQKIKRINELYHKSKEAGLSEDELCEQAMLRKEYIENVRKNLRGQLDCVSIQEEDGSITDLGRIYGQGNTGKKDSSSAAHKG